MLLSNTGRVSESAFRLIPGWWAELSVGAEAGWAGPPEAAAEGAEGCGSPAAAALRRRWWGKGSGRE